LDHSLQLNLAKFEFGLLIQTGFTCLPPMALARLTWHETEQGNRGANDWKILMSLESARAELNVRAPDIAVIIAAADTSTVQAAAAGLGVSPPEIAKTLAFWVNDKACLLVASGEARLDNKKAKATFGTKIKMLSFDEVEAVTGHPVGGVCPFGLKSPLEIYCDQSLLAFETVYPAAGSVNSAIKISTKRLGDLTGGRWVDVCTVPQTVSQAEM
jgi:Cys-tRNA(Pro) deacylase